MAQPKLVATTEFKIEKGVPMPANAARQKYPFDRMEVSDSIALPKSARSSAYTWAKRHNRTFVVLPEGDGIRVWRTA